MALLVTGAAGFIGHHVTGALLARGERVIGIDDLNAYYDPALKRARLAQIADVSGFRFECLDIADHAAMEKLAATDGPSITGVVHLAAQAGVRHSLDNPFAYVKSNLDGHMVVLEFCRHLPRLRHLVYASSSSVYGGSRRIPFALDDPADQPVSLYAATKRADELLTHAYSHLYDLPATGLRFFTVYGPWGRPDMAYFSFAEAITAGRPIRLFNHGAMRRDFTYVDDVVAGVLAALDRPPATGTGEAPHRLYNLGNSQPVELARFVALLEQALGRSAVIEYAPMQPGDVEATWADIEASRRDLGYAPAIAIEDGLGRFTAWFRDWKRRPGT